MKKRIGILNSGGDCPGLNAVIYGAFRAASNLGWEVIGFRDGFEGLLPPASYEILTPQRTAGIMAQGGTILGTTNKGNFIAMNKDGTKAEAPKESIEQARLTLEQLGIGALIIVGGDGTLTTALQFHEADIPVIGVPKTIDNDLRATSMTFGFDSAVAFVTDALDRLNTTASAHKRVMTIEAMGRHAGWIALYGGFGGGADIILLPEIPFSFEKVAESVERRFEEGDDCVLVVVAEGAIPKDGEMVGKDSKYGGQIKLGGIGAVVAEEIVKRTGRETRNCVLGHLQRGGAPTMLDRLLGTRFGVKAVELISDGKFGHMVSYENYVVTDVPIADAVHKLRNVEPDNQMVKMARAIGITFGD